MTDLHRPFLGDPIRDTSELRRRVDAYLDGWEGRRLPSLARIMRECGCKRGQAYRWRQAWKARQYDVMRDRQFEIEPQRAQ